MKIAFFETKPWEEDYLKDKLSAHELFFFPEPLDQNHLTNQKDFEAISVFTDSKIDQVVVSAYPNLKLISTRTTGTDHIDPNAIKARQITLRNVLSYGENTVAEYAFALLLALTRKIIASAERVKEKSNFTSEGLTGTDLAGKTLGVIGTGRIGQHSIRIGNGFQMKVLGFDAFPNPELETTLNFKYSELNNLLANSDVITLHTPYLPTTHHLINQSNVFQIKKGAILINTSRGAVVETEAIVAALNQGILSGAGLDVLEEETNLKNERQMLIEKQLSDTDLRTVLENHVLIGMDNVIITPHNAFNSREALQRILDTTVENIIKP